MGTNDIWGKKYKERRQANRNFGKYSQCFTTVKESVERKKREIGKPKRVFCRNS